MNEDRIYSLRQMPPEIAPKGAPVLVAGGIAMKKTGGKWFSGMSAEPFTRELNWTPEWWAAIPNGNDPLPQSSLIPTGEEAQPGPAPTPTAPAAAEFWPCVPVEYFDETTEMGDG